MKRFFKGLYSLILFHYFPKANDTEYHNRLQICFGCREKRTAAILDWLGINRSQPICGKCGCLLYKKCRLLHESCPLNKW